jgi:hypothetical protein
MEGGKIEFTTSKSKKIEIDKITKKKKKKKRQPPKLKNPLVLTVPPPFNYTKKNIRYKKVTNLYCQTTTT